MVYSESSNYYLSKIYLKIYGTYSGYGDYKNLNNYFFYSIPTFYVFYSKTLTNYWFFDYFKIGNSVVWNFYFSKTAQIY